MTSYMSKVQGKFDFSIHDPFKDAPKCITTKRTNDVLLDNQVLNQLLQLKDPHKRTVTHFMVFRGKSR